MCVWNSIPTHEPEYDEVNVEDFKEFTQKLTTELSEYGEQEVHYIKRSIIINSDNELHIRSLGIQCVSLFSSVQTFLYRVFVKWKFLVLWSTVLVTSLN